MKSQLLNIVILLPALAFSLAAHSSEGIGGWKNSRYEMQDNQFSDLQRLEERTESNRAINKEMATEKFESELALIDGQSYHSYHTASHYNARFSAVVEAYKSGLSEEEIEKIYLRRFKFTVPVEFFRIAKQELANEAASR